MIGDYFDALTLLFLGVCFIFIFALVMDYFTRGDE